MKNKFKPILALLLVAVMFPAIVSCSTSSDSNKNENSVTFSVDVAEQTNDKWKMTFKECQTKTKLNSFTEADEGEEFVLAFFEIENLSQEIQTFSTLIKGMGDFYFDGVKTSQVVGSSSIINDSYPLLSVPVDPGKKANGYFVFQIAPEWHELEIIYDDDLLHKSEENVMKFIITKNTETASETESNIANEAEGGTADKTADNTAEPTEE